MGRMSSALVPLRPDRLASPSQVSGAGGTTSRQIEVNAARRTKKNCALKAPGLGVALRRKGEEPSKVRAPSCPPQRLLQHLHGSSRDRPREQLAGRVTTREDAIRLRAHGAAFACVQLEFVAPCLPSVAAVPFEWLLEGQCQLGQKWMQRASVGSRRGLSKPPNRSLPRPTECKLRDCRSLRTPVHPHDCVRQRTPRLNNSLLVFRKSVGMLAQVRLEVPGQTCVDTDAVRLCDRTSAAVGEKL